jgi:3D (Asp-Asp-Asp) domain-containing protein
LAEIIQNKKSLITVFIILTLILGVTAVKSNAETAYPQTTVSQVPENHADQAKPIEKTDSVVIESVKAEIPVSQSVATTVARENAIKGMLDQKLTELQAKKDEEAATLAAQKLEEQKKALASLTVVNGNNDQYVEVQAELTAYALTFEDTGKYPDDPLFGVTASGIKVSDSDKILAAPPDIPFNTVIDVPFYGTVKVLDRGSLIQRKPDGMIKLDLLMPSEELAKQFGIKVVTVRIKK